MNSSLVHQFLEKSALKFPEKVALVHGEVRATYREIERLVDCLAGWLVDRGVLSGDRVVILLENSLEYVVSYYGILKAGAIAVPLGTDLKPDGLQPLLDELEAKVLISNFRFERLLKAVDLNASVDLIIKQAKLSWSDEAATVFPWDDIVNGEKHVSPDLPTSHELSATSQQPSEIASIIYTSGSTGKPKGVMLTHQNIVSNVQSICEYLRLSDQDIQMVVLPFFYVMGKSLLNTHFAVGGRVVINNKFAFPAAVLKEMADEKVTGFSGVPSTYAYLLHRSPLKDYRDKLPDLRYCSQAGGHMAKAVKENLRRILPEHTDIYIMYGATEAAARLSFLMPEHFAEKIDSIGKAIPGAKLQIIDEQGRVKPCGESGELVAWGENIMPGYWRDKSATAAKFGASGYYRTGDQGYMDEDGFFYIVGRRDNMVKVGGHRINLQETEDKLAATGMVVEAAVISAPDPLLGNRLLALVVPVNNEISEKQLRKSLAALLPRHKLPAEIKFLRSLPKKASGKIDLEKCRV